MTLQELVDKFGEVRVSKFAQPIEKWTVVDNRPVREIVDGISYIVTARNAEPVHGQSVEEALALLE